MTNEPTDPLARRLDEWRPEISGPSDLKAEVWRRIGRLEAESAPANGFRRPALRGFQVAFAVLAGVACCLTLLLIRERRVTRAQGELNAQLARGYLSLIDPLLDEPAAPASTDRDLIWLRDALHLSRDQYARIKAFHEATAPQLRLLAQQMAEMKAELAAMEAKRRAEDQVDFLAVARLAQSRQRLDRQCAASTQKLIQDAATAMTPDQRASYLRYVRSALSAPPGSPDF